MPNSTSPLSDYVSLAPAAIRYQPSFERVDENEAEINASLIETIKKIQSKVFEDSGQAMRGVHAKCHGVLIGECRVLDNLPPVLAQGMFARAAVYPVIMRFSTIPGDMLDDGISVPRGLALKVLGVSGPRVAGSEGDTTQDFVFGNGAVFSKAHPKGFLSTLKLLAATTDKAPGLKKALSAVMRGAERLVESVGGESSILMTLGGYPEVHILGEDFYSQAPILYGDYIVKVAIKPASAGLRSLRGSPLDLKGKPDGIREALVDFFTADGGEWDLQVQLSTDLDSMPIEDAAKAWPEDKSPYLTVARIVAAPQAAWSPRRIKAVDEGMSFSPWHALAAHRPLGAIMRVRKAVYDAAARFRAEHNGITVIEPSTVQGL